MVRIAVENSTWNNIGDGFYQTSLVTSFSEVRPDARVSEFDGPMTRAFRATEGSLTQPWYDSRFDVAAEVFILSGPILSGGFLRDYGDLIRSIRARGGHYMLLSAFAKLNDGSLESNLAFLREHPPLAFSSRDDPTYEAFASISDFSFRGICSAYYVSSINGIPDVEPREPYFLSSFYTRPEPIFNISPEAAAAHRWGELEIDAPEWKHWRFTRHLQFLAKRQSSIAGYRIVRPVQDIAYKFAHLNFPVSNRYLSYNPRTYLSVFKGAEFAVSDRVHACVAAMSFGKPAKLVGKFDRAALLDAHGVVDRSGSFMVLDQAKVAEMRTRFHTFLDQALTSIRA